MLWLADGMVDALCDVASVCGGGIIESVIIVVDTVISSLVGGSADDLVVAPTSAR